MATLEQLSAALVKADAAGDTDAAKTFASEIRRMQGAQPEKTTIAQDAKQTAGNVAAGLVRGAGSIGATILAPWDIAQDAMAGKGLSLESNRERRAAMDAALGTLGAETDSFGYGAGKLAGEIAGTAGAGGLVARGAAPVLQAVAPRIAAPLTNAIASGGLSTGARAAMGPAALSRGADLAVRTAGGAIAGGASAGLINPEDADTGALIGGALPGTLKAAGAVGRKIGQVVRGPEQSPDMLNAVKSAIDAGYVIPPTQAKPTIGNRLLEGISGKITTAQNASAKNAEVTNKLAAKALGLSDDVKVTPEVLADVRNAAGQAYRDVAELPPLPSFNETKKELLAKISKAQSEKETALQAAGKLQSFAAQQKSLATGKDFKLSLNQPENQLYYNTGSMGRTAQSPSSLPVPGFPRFPARYTNNIDRVKEGMQGADEAMQVFTSKRMEEDAARKALSEFEASAAKLPTKEAINPNQMVFDLRKTRNEADAWYKAYGRSADPDALAKAQAAKAEAAKLQDTLEAYAKSIGRNDLVQKMVESRKLIAKTYSVENALNSTTGNIDARKLARQLEKGKPLSGELKQVAEFAARFPKANQTIEGMGSLPQTSPLDWATFGGIGAATANPLALLGVAARPIARAAVLSGPVQNRLANPQMQNQLAELLSRPEGQQLLYRLAPQAAISR